MRWRDITTSEDYQNLTPENKLVTKQEFFRSQVLPQVRQESVLNRFSDEALEQAWLDLPDDSGQGYFTSLLGSAGRGFTSVAPGVVGGLGYLTGSETLKQAGEDIEESLAEAIPVNPRYEQDFAMKAFGAVGQAGSMLATGGIGGAAAKGLAAVKGLNQATQIARAGQAARGAQLGSGFLQGTRGGGQEAEQYGIEGPAAYARAVGGGVIEGATELLPFGLGTESAAVRRLLGETGEKVTRGFVEDVGTEAAEEAIAQTASNVATMGTLAATGSEVEGPGVFDDTLESAALGAVGGATFGGVNLLTGARDPREFKDPIDGGEMPMTPFPEVNDLVEEATPELAEVTSPEAAEVVGEAVKQASEVALATPGETGGDLLTDFAVQPTPQVAPEVAPEVAPQPPAPSETQFPTAEAPSQPTYADIARKAAAVASGEAPPQVSQAVEAVLENRATPEQVEQLEEQGLADTVAGEPVITDEGAAQLPADEQPALDEQERREEITLQNPEEARRDVRAIEQMRPGIERAAAIAQFSIKHGVPTTVVTEAQLDEYIRTTSEPEELASTNRRAQEDLATPQPAPEAGPTPESATLGEPTSRDVGTQEAAPQPATDVTQEEAPAELPLPEDQAPEAAEKRDATKPEQMTPEEAFQKSDAKIWVTPEEYKKQTPREKGVPFSIYSEDRDRALRSAMREGLRIPKEWFVGVGRTVETRTKNAVSMGYRAQGDLWVTDRPRTFDEQTWRSSEEGRRHADQVLNAIGGKQPVSADSAVFYASLSTLPEGYVRQGDLYVYQSKGASTTYEQRSDKTTAGKRKFTTRDVPPPTSEPVVEDVPAQDVQRENRLSSQPTPEQEPPPWWDSEADAIVDRLMEEDVTSPTGQGRLRRDVKELSTRNSERFKEVAEAVGAKPNVASVVNGIVSAFTNPVATAEVAKPKKAKKPRKRRSFLAYGKQLDIQVREGDIAAAVEAEADIPGAAQTQVGTSDELIDLYSDNPKVSRMLEQAKEAGAEGFYDPDTDMVFVLTDELAVYESDRDAAAVNNTTPAQEAVRRVIRHENAGHRGWGGMPQYLRDKWLAVANQLMSAEDADDLVKRFGYKEYKDWRTNETSRARLFEEWVARKAEEPKFAKALSSQRYRPLRDFLRELWGWITGNTNEIDPDDKQLLELFNDMRRGAKVGRTAKVQPKVRQTPLAAEFQRLRQKAFAGQLTGVEIDEYAAKVSKIPAADAKAVINELGFVVPRTRKAVVESLRKTLSDSQKRATRYSRRALGTTLNDLMPSVVDAYHRAAEGSSTAFIPLTDIYQNLPPNFSEGEFARQVQGMVSSGRAYLEPVNQVVEGQMVVNDPNTGQPGGWLYLVDDTPRFSLKAVENYESRKRSFDNSMRRPFAAQAAGQRPTSGEFAARVQKERLPSETLEQAAIELIKEIGPMREWARKLRDGNWVADNGISAELHHAAVREATLQATQAEQASGGRDSEASFVAERMRRLDEQLSSEAGRQLRMRGIAVDSKRFNELYAINALKSTQDQQLASTLDRIVNVRNAVERTEGVDASAREEAATNVASELELLELGMSMLDPKVKGLVTELNDELAILGLLSQQDLKASLTGRTPAELDALREKIASMNDAEKQAQLETSRARVAKLIRQIRKTAKKDGPTPQEQAEQLLATAPQTVRDAYRDQLRNPVTRSEFLKKLTGLGVEADTAQKLFDTAAAKVASAAAVEEAELSREQKAANSLIDSLANTHSDTPAWPKTAKTNQMRELYRKHMKEPMERDAFVNEAVDLGVTEQSAGQLWDIAQNELVARGRVKDVKRQEALEKARAKRRQALLDLTPKAPRTKGESKPRSLLGLLNKVRREAGVNWTELFSHPFEYQKQWRQELFNKVRADEAFKDLSDQEVRDVAAELDRLWNAERQKIVERELKKLTPSTNPEVRERVSKSTSRLLRAINNGSLNDAEFRKAIAPQFGIGQLTQEELDEVGRLAQIIQDEDAATPEKNRASIKLMELLQSRSKLSAAEVLSNIWVTSVLSGLRTQFDMAFNFLNGIRIFGQMAASTAIRAGETKLVGRAAKDYFGTLLNGMREALVYIGTGDAALLNSTEKRMNSYLGEGVRAVPQDIWERITKDPETPTYQKPFSAFLALVQRAMIAWDHITAASTTEGMKALAVANNQAAYANARLPTKEDIAKAQARAEQIVAGELPAGANLKSQANQARITVARRQILDDIYEKQFPGLLDQARDIGLVSAYQNDPTGLGGFIYHTLLNLTKTLTQSAKQFRGRVDAELSDAEKMRLGLRVRDAMAKLAMFTAVNSRSLTGTRFVRFVGNKINEMLSFLPGIGLARLGEDVMQENPLQRHMLWSNQVVGGMVSTALLATVLKSAFDSDAEDEENPPFMVNGPWKPLTSAQRNAMRSVGSAPNTVEFRDDEGNVTVFNYANWPISGLLATAGNMMDLYRFNRKKWDEKDFLDRVGSAAVSGALVFTDMSAISGLMNVLATTANERDPTEGFLNRLSQWAANYAGGFIPRMAKDIDTLTSPEYERPVDRLDYFIKEVPFYRRGRSGNKALNLMGEPVKINREPWSRAVVRTTVEKPYRVAAELMEKGVFFTAPNPLNRTVKIPGTDERRNLTDAESETYVKESGKMYRQFFDSEGDSLVEMEPDLAKKYVDERLRSFRDLALTLATQ